MFIVSPFLDVETVRKAGRWGGTKTRRTLVSIDPEFQRLVREDGQVFSGFQNLCRQPLPNLPQESAVNIEEQNSTAVALTEAEEAPPQGLHAKLMFAARGKRRQLWIGSANATERGWGGNFEIVAELAVNQEVADGIEAFVDTCERYTPIAAENHYAQAETTAREVVKEFEKQRERDGLLEAREILARSLLGTKQCNAASEEIGRALTLAKQSQDPRLRASVAITESRIQDACDSGSSSRAKARLLSATRDSQARGFVALALESKLAFVELEARTGFSNTNDNMVASLIQEASARGFALIANHAKGLQTRPLSGSN